MNRRESTSMVNHLKRSSQGDRLTRPIQMDCRASTGSNDRPVTTEQLHSLAEVHVEIDHTPRWLTKRIAFITTIRESEEAN